MQIIPSCVAVKNARLENLAYFLFFLDLIDSAGFISQRFLICIRAANAWNVSMCILMNTITQFSWGSKMQIWKWIPAEANPKKTQLSFMKVFSHILYILGTQTCSWSESVTHTEQVPRRRNTENDRHIEEKKKSQSHECFMGHNGLLKFPHHTLASTDTPDQGLSWHLCPTDTQQHMVCNSDTSGALAAAECGQSYELWIWANCFLIWKVLLF